MGIRVKMGLKYGMLSLILISCFWIAYFLQSHVHQLEHLLVDLIIVILLFILLTLGINRRYLLNGRLWTLFSYGLFSVISLMMYHLYIIHTRYSSHHSATDLIAIWLIMSVLGCVSMTVAHLLRHTTSNVWPKVWFVTALLLWLLSLGFVYDDYMMNLFSSHIVQYLSPVLIALSIVYLMAITILVKRWENEETDSIVLYYIISMYLSTVCILQADIIDDYYHIVAHLLMIASLLVPIIHVLADDKRRFGNHRYQIAVGLFHALETATSGIIIMDEQGSITFSNHTANQVFSESSMVGQSLWDYLNPECRKEIQHALRTHNNYNGEVALDSIELSPIIVSIHPFHVFNRLKRYMFMFYQTTETRKIRELTEAEQKAEQSNQAMSDFLAYISHEIRTPLNGIIGFVQLLEDTPLSKDQSEYIRNINVSMDTLLKIVNDFLDLSKIEAGKMELEPVPFNFRLVVNNAVNVYKAQANEKGLRLEVQIDERIPPFLKGDARRLKQIIMNLVNNAIKFTKTGYVKVKTKAIKPHLIEFSVEDTGIGLSDEERECILQPYLQFHSTKKYGGTGLGLTICKSFIELMNGTLEVDSKLDVGTTFRFTIPFELIQPEAVFEFVQQKSLFEPMKKYPNAKVLLVEDDEVNRKFFTLLMEEKGIKCDIAYNGLEAIEKWRNNDYDIIFMDCHMPILDGYEATRQIRQLEEEGHRTVIVALTAMAMKGDAERCFQAGMDDYIAKPIQLGQLITILNKYLSNSVEVKNSE